MRDLLPFGLDREHYAGVLPFHLIKAGSREVEEYETVFVFVLLMCMFFLKCNSSPSSHGSFYVWKYICLRVYVLSGVCLCYFPPYILSMSSW